MRNCFQRGPKPWVMLAALLVLLTGCVEQKAAPPERKTVRMDLLQVDAQIRKAESRSAVDPVTAMDRYDEAITMAKKALADTPGAVNRYEMVDLMDRASMGKARCQISMAEESMDPNRKKRLLAGARQNLTTVVNKNVMGYHDLNQRLEQMSRLSSSTPNPPAGPKPAQPVPPVKQTQPAAAPTVKEPVASPPSPQASKEPVGSGNTGDTDQALAKAGKQADSARAGAAVAAKSAEAAGAGAARASEQAAAATDAAARALTDADGNPARAEKSAASAKEQASQAIQQADRAKQTAGQAISAADKAKQQALLTSGGSPETRKKAEQAIRDADAARTKATLAMENAEEARRKAVQALTDAGEAMTRAASALANARAAEEEAEKKKAVVKEAPEAVPAQAGTGDAQDEKTVYLSPSTLAGRKGTLQVGESATFTVETSGKTRYSLGDLEILVPEGYKAEGEKIHLTGVKRVVEKGNAMYLRYVSLKVPPKSTLTVAITRRDQGAETYECFFYLYPR